MRGLCAGEKIYEWLGVHKNGEDYVFRAYYPEAETAEVTGDFNSWGKTLMNKIEDGVWEAVVKSEIPLDETCYKYRFYNRDKCVLMPDPYARYAQCGKNDASIAYFGEYSWQDEKWMRGRQTFSVRKSPVNIYEMDLGTWRVREGRSHTDIDVYLNYRDIAAELAGYVSDMGYTHISIVSVSENGQGYAPSSKFGRPDDFKFFVDTLHQAGIGVVLELKEKTDIEFWIAEYHIDGFLTNAQVQIDKFEGVFFIGEGKEYDLFINREWSERVMDYAETEPQYKKYKYGGLNMSLSDGFDKNDILAVSFSCVSCGKGSLFEKMQGSYEEKFARLKLFYSYMMFHSGKKMTFMGCEIGERAEWNGKDPIEWFLLDCAANLELKRYVREINKLYLSMPALWESDFSWRGFEWISPLSSDNELMMFLRKSSIGETVIAVLNFSENQYREAFVDKNIEIILSSKSDEVSLCGGLLQMPPLSAVVLGKTGNENDPFFEKALDYSTDI